MDLDVGDGMSEPALVRGLPLCVSSAPPPTVGRAVEEPPPLATHRSCVPRAVHVWPETQQPPPSEAGQENWLEVQPVGDGLTVLIVAGLMVLLQELEKRQTEPTEQQDPPTDCGQR